MIELTLDEERVKYKELIDSSRFRDRISFLVNNPDLASSTLNSQWGIFKPCCWGTTAYLLGANEKVKDIWLKEGNVLDDYSDALGDFIIIPDNDKPGYIGMVPMQLYLDTLQEKDMEKDCVVGLFWESPNCEGFTGFGLGHTGIYLGEYEGKHIMFEQKQIGKRFRFVSIDDRVSELGDDSRRTLKMRYYSTSLLL